MLWVSHRVKSRENRFRGVLTTTSPLRIGSGKEPPLGATVDLVVLRIRYNGYEVPYIPGSSLKGVFRNSAYTLIKAKGLMACKDNKDNNCLRRLKNRDRDKEVSCEEFDQDACLLCKIFGSEGYRSKTSFFDAYPLMQGGGYTFSLGSRPGVRIDRKSGVAVNRYEVEYVEPGTKFSFEITSSSLPNYALGLLSMIFILMNRGEIKLGGFKSRGFGEVVVEELEFSSTEGKTMSALDSKDTPVELPLVQDNDWIARGKEAWKALEKLAGIWNGFKG